MARGAFLLRKDSEYEIELRRRPKRRTPQSPPACPNSPPRSSSFEKSHANREDTLKIADLDETKNVGKTTRATFSVSESGNEVADADVVRRREWEELCGAYSAYVKRK
jgi:hypothetical protein